MELDFDVVRPRMGQWRLLDDLSANAMGADDSRPRRGALRM